jgi:hypothetical protein
VVTLIHLALTHVKICQIREVSLTKIRLRESDLLCEALVRPPQVRSLQRDRTPAVRYRRRWRRRGLLGAGCTEFLQEFLRLVDRISPALPVALARGYPSGFSRLGVGTPRLDVLVCRSVDANNLEAVALFVHRPLGSVRGVPSQAHVINVVRGPIPCSPFRGEHGINKPELA